MFNKIFKKKEKENLENNNILIAALLIHAAKIDENYTDKEKEIIKKAITNLYSIKLNEAGELIKKAEKRETEDRHGYSGCRL